MRCHWFFLNSKFKNTVNPADVSVGDVVSVKSTEHAVVALEKP